INWHLYQIYKKLENTDKTAIYKNVILTKYPNTVFAKIIKNPNVKIEKTTTVDKVEEKYKEVYYLYKKEKYKETVKKVDEIMPTLKNSKLIPKFELLKAYGIGKYLDKKTYKFALNTIVIKYPNTKEGKKAKQILNQLNK
ncbi:MAG: tetratricopeptide repeat protein, partial [Polaribacter sp.]